MLRGILSIKKRVALCAAALVVSLPSHPACSSSDPDLSPFQAVYSGNYNGLRIETHRTLAVEPDGTYVISTRASNFLGKIDETSRFRLDSSGRILVDQYRYHRSILGIKKTETVDFDWPNNTAVYQTKKRQRQAALDDKPMDRVTYQLQMQRDLRAGKKEMDYPIVDRGKLRDYRFGIIGEEIIDTKLGKVSTIKIKRIRDDSSKRETIIWVAPEWDYLLVRLQQLEEDGEIYELDLESAIMDGRSIAVASKST